MKHPPARIKQTFSCNANDLKCNMKKNCKCKRQEDTNQMYLPHIIFYFTVDDDVESAGVLQRDDRDNDAWQHGMKCKNM